MSNKSLSMSQHNTHKTPAKSLLSLAITAVIASTGIIASTPSSADEVSCTNDNCTTKPLVDTPTGRGRSQYVLTTGVNAANNATTSLSGNTVTLNNTQGKFKQPKIWTVIGALSTNSDVLKNNVKIETGYLDDASVYGGLTGSGDAHENTITINGGVADGEFYAGYSAEGTAKKNKIIITKGILEGSSIYGGHGNTATENAVILGNDKGEYISFEGQLIGGRSKDGNITNNTITATNATIVGYFIGGYSTGTGDALNNTVTLNGVTVYDDIYGGLTGGNAQNNTVTLEAGGGDNIYGGKSFSQSNALDNTVTLNDSSIRVDVYGGHSSEGNALDNTVTLNDSSIEKDVYGGYSSEGNAQNNTVTLNGGTVNGNIYGGYSDSIGAANNTVIISGGHIEGNIYGGEAYENSETTGNTVTLASGKALSLGNSTIIWGGSDTIDLTNNTLNIHRKDIVAADVKNFENYHFYIGADVAKDNTILTLTSGGTTDISESNYGVGVESNSSLAPGDEIVLIDKVNGTLTLSSETPANNVTGMSGISKIYEFELKGRNNNTEAGNDQLVARVIGDETNPQTKAVLEGGLAGVSFVNSATDVAQKSGIDALQNSTSANKHAFMTSSAGGSRTETGSHIDVRGVNSLIGIGTNVTNSAGNFSFAGFTEFGFGSYKAFNEIKGKADVNSDGSTRYYGLGIMGKQSFSNGLALNAGISAGRSHSTFNSNDIVDGNGKSTHFSSTRNYISAFAGADYDIALDETSRVTLSGSIKNTRYNSDSVKISDETFNLDAITSTRSTIGAQWSKTLANDAVFSAGAAWEHEFDGTAAGNVNDMAIAKPSLKGDTGIINVGYRVKASDNLTFGVGAEGSFGKRRGASINAVFNYTF